MIPYLRIIDQGRIYSNHGPTLQKLEGRLAEHFGIDPSALALSSSGTSALIGLILSVAGPASQERNLCICPSYTFVATAVAARSCGYVPFLAEIEKSTWMLDPQHIERLPELARAGLVIVVAPYGHFPDIEPWQAFSERTKLPVIIDAAACFDSIDAEQVTRGTVSVAISLHATKTLSCAEGGLILSGDREVVERAVRALNFGFSGDRQSIGSSINGKLSEYHAAVGLADLDGWAAKRDGFLAVARAYERHACRQGLKSRIVVNTTQAIPYVLLDAADTREADQVIQALDQAHIGHRRWYGWGLHRQPAYADCPSESLANTECVAGRLIGLPCASDLADSHIETVVMTVAGALS